MPLAAVLPDYDPPAELARAQADLFDGQAQAAVTRLEALVAAEPSQIVAAYWLAAAKGAAGDHAAFKTLLNDAAAAHALGLLARGGVDVERLRRDPVHAEGLAQGIYGEGHVAVASAAYAFAAAVPGASAFAMRGYALSLQHQGRADEALEAFTKVCEAYPQSSNMRSFLLYILFHVEDGVRRHAEAAVEWSKTYAGTPLPAPASFPNQPIEGRRLRIGYVAPSIGNQLRQFLMPVLENHDREQVDVTVYVNDAPAGPVAADRVRVLGNMHDADAADVIRAEGIDVLVDLWGHTARSRLGAFGLKPAPVQVSWMNYVQTTGMPAMDYLLHPDSMATPDAQDHCVETIWHIGPVISPFRPDVRPEPTPTPAKANGFVTFGSYNHPIRLNDQTLAAWARILREAPTSRLVLRYRYFVDEVLQNVTLMRFAAQGVAPHRIEFREQLAQPEYYQSYADIDVALDPSPCPGGVTSMDAVANGVPLVTLAGADYYSRTGVHVLEPLGLNALIATSWDAYVRKAVDLTLDIPALDALRRQVRTAFDTSPRRDEVGFTRRLESDFRKMFGIWQAARDAGR